MKKNVLSLIFLMFMSTTLNAALCYTAFSAGAGFTKIGTTFTAKQMKIINTLNGDVKNSFKKRIEKQNEILSLTQKIKAMRKENYKVLKKIIFNIKKLKNLNEIKAEILMTKQEEK